VGIDGTDGSAAALLWAAGEARVRGRPLRIVHAAPHLGAPTGADLHAYATAALAHARTVVRDLDPPLEVREELVREEPVTALVTASATSVLLVLGSWDTARARSGVGRRVRDGAGCPVVVVAGALPVPEVPCVREVSVVPDGTGPRAAPVHESSGPR
jgi:nucleotide-binding universal stress UspA family protein